MMSWFSRKMVSRKIMSAVDSYIRLVLKQHDPVAVPDALSLLDLEADILARIGSRHRRAVEPDSGMLAALFQQNWSLRGVVCASLFIMASGFIVGQIAYGTTSAPSFIGTPSILALADENTWAATPVSNSSLEESDDNAE